jgi:uncharacterized delta-60 repeat protein
MPFFHPSLEIMESRCMPSAGQLDPTFGENGIITTDIGGSTSDTASAIATQSDGKVVVLGASLDVSGDQIALVRYTSTGGLDTSFGNNGQVTFNFVDSPSRSDSASALAVDGSGHIIVARSTTSPSLSSKVFALAELNPNGSFDTAFGHGGIAIFETSANTYDATAASLTTDSAGHILLAGSVSTDDPNVGFNHFSTLIRFNSDGSPDTSFGQNGEANFSFAPNDTSSVTSVAIDSSGQLVVGDAASNSTTNGAFAVARLNNDGSLDTSFGQGGKAIVSLGPNTQSSDTGMALDSAGRIVLVGTEYRTVSPFTESFVVTRLKTDGSIDTGFGTGGVTTIGNSIAGVAIDSSDRIVLADYAYYNIPRSGYANAIAVNRLNSDGTPDTSFGTDGQGIIVPVAGFNQLAGIAIDPSGRIDVASSAGSSSASSDFLAVRFDSSGNPDSSWGVAGQVTTDVIGPSTDQAAALSITQSDGKMLVVGTSQAAAGFPNEFLVVARYNADGSLDSTFGQGGKATFAYDYRLAVNPPTPTAVTVDPSGRILVTGTSAGDFAVLRLNADGSLDASFGNGGEATVGFGTFTGNNGYTYDSYDTAAGVVVDASGRLLLFGTTSTNSSAFAVARLNTDGSLDTSFGSGGKTTISFGGPGVTYDTASGLTIDAAGCIIVAGTTSVNNSNTGSFAVSRLKPDGSLDPSFGSGGETTFSFGRGYTNSYTGITSHFDTVAGVAIDPEGRIVVAGDTTDQPYGGNNSFAVARLNAADGSLDQSYGNGGEVIVSNLNPISYSVQSTQLATDSAGRFALVGALEVGNYEAMAAAVFNPDGTPDVDFGISGLSSIDNVSVAGAAFDPAGRLVIAGTQTSPLTGADFAVTRVLGRDTTLEAGSKTFAMDLQAAVTNLGTMQPPLTPRLVIHVSSPSQMAGVSNAIAKLTVNPSGQTIEMMLEVDAGSYSLGKVSVPAGLQLIIDDGGSKSFGRFASNTTPAMTLVSGDVIIRNGVMFTGSGAVPAIKVLDGHLFMRGSTITQTTTASNQWGLLIAGGQVDLGTDFSDNMGNNTFSVNGPGLAIRLTGPNNVPALGDTFIENGSQVTNDFRIEDLIDHAMDGLNGGLVDWSGGALFVSGTNGRAQRGVDLAPDGGYVSIESGVGGHFDVGSKVLNGIIFGDGSEIVPDLSGVSQGSGIVVYGTQGDDSIKFAADGQEVRVSVNQNPSGSFLVTGRLVVHGEDGSDDIRVGSGVTLSAWLYGGATGNNYLQGGGGNDVLIGGDGNDTLVGGGGRDLLIGSGGNDLLDGRGGDDILIGGGTYYGYEGWGYEDEISLSAIMAEWTSANDYATRVNHIVNGGGLNGSAVLASGATLYDAGGSSTLVGGTGQDLFFASATDAITDRRKYESVYSI